MNINSIDFASSFYGKKPVKIKNIYFEDEYGIKRGRRTQRSKSAQHTSCPDDCFVCRDKRVKCSQKRADIYDAPVYGCADY